MDLATAQMSEPRPKKKKATSRTHLALAIVSSWPTNKIRPHWVTVC